VALALALVAAVVAMPPFVSAVVADAAAALALPDAAFSDAAAADAAGAAPSISMAPSTSFAMYF
jgi:hypothetical protein